MAKLSPTVIISLFGPLLCTIVFAQFASYLARGAVLQKVPLAGGKPAARKLALDLAAGQLRWGPVCAGATLPCTCTRLYARTHHVVCYGTNPVVHRLAKKRQARTTEPFVLRGGAGNITSVSSPNFFHGLFMH